MPKFENSGQKLRELAWKGMDRLGYRGKKEYEERLEYELDNVIKAGFADYFLMLEDLFDWHINKRKRCPSIGRGSAAASLILNCLNITHLDPVKNMLPFERFLDASRLTEIIESGGKVSGCFAGETMIKVENGIKPIKDIQVGEFVYGSDNKLHKVLNTWNHGIQKTVKCIYVSNGKKYCFEVTTGHIFPKRLSNGKMIEQKIGQFFIGDKLLSSLLEEKEIFGFEKGKITEVYDIEVEKDHHYIICGKPV